MKRSTIEKAFAGIVLFLSTGALLPLLLVGDQADRGNPESSIVIRAVWALIYLITVGLLARRWKNTLWLATRDIALLGLLAIAILSVLWSAVPDVTLRRGIALMGTTMVGVLLAQRFTFDEVISVAAWALGAAAVLSFVFAIAVPELGIMSGKHAGAWRGVFTHKNELGQRMAFGAIVFLLAHRRKHRWIRALGAGSCVLLLLMSTSKTALVVLIAVAAILMLWRYSRLEYRLLIPYILASSLLIAVLAFWTLTNYSNILAALGRDATLTGRTILWSVAVDAVQRKPILGYGYDGFWTGWEGEAAWVWSFVGWTAPHAHNGILDLMLNLGVVGAAVFLIGISVNIKRAFAWARMNSRYAALWPVFLFAFIIGFSLAESAILRRNNYLWILYVDSTIRLAVWYRTRWQLRRVEGAAVEARIDSAPA